MADKKTQSRWRIEEANDQGAELVRDDGVRATATLWTARKDKWGLFLRAPRGTGPKDFEAWKQLLAERYGPLAPRKQSWTVSGLEADLEGAGPRKKG